MSNEDSTIRPGVQAVAPSAAVPLSAPVNATHAQLLGLLRDVRAEVQNLRRSLEDVIAKDAMDDAEMRIREILATISNNYAIYNYNSKQIHERLNQLREVINTNPALYDRYGDEIIHIENEWERAGHQWPYLKPQAEGETVIDDEGPVSPDEGDVEALLKQAHQVIVHLDAMIYHVGLLTIPSRLNQHLEQLRIGQKLDFHNTFEDEIANQTDRDKILKYLDARPNAIPNGVIDVLHGVVVHASGSHSRRRLSFFAITLVILLGAFLAAGTAEVANWLDLENWPVTEDQTTELVVGYAFMIVGGIVHIGVDAIKQARGGNTGRALLALEDGFTWIHINEIGIIIGIISMWVGFYGLVFVNGSINWQTAFLVGYSIDSFVDIFLQRFNTDISNRTAALKI